MRLDDQAARQGVTALRHVDVHIRDSPLRTLHSMNEDLQRQLPELLHAAIVWARQQEESIAIKGQPLPAQGIELARRVGVRRPELVRLQVVPEIPLPDHPGLRALSLSLGAISGNTDGLTLGHSIYIRQGQGTSRLVSHELRHVFQYELLGGIEMFMSVYLPQLLIHGYRHAPLEQDAEAHEI